MIIEALHQVANHCSSLSREMAREVMTEILSGAATDAQIAALLVALLLVCACCGCKTFHGSRFYISRVVLSDSSSLPTLEQDKQMVEQALHRNSSSAKNRDPPKDIGTSRNLVHTSKLLFP